MVGLFGSLAGIAVMVLGGWFVPCFILGAVIEVFALDYSVRYE